MCIVCVTIGRHGVESAQDEVKGVGVTNSMGEGLRRGR